MDKQKIASTDRAMYTMPSTDAKSSMVSNTFTVFRSRNAIIDLLFLSCFKLLLVRSKRLLKRRACLVNRDFPHNAPFDASQPCLPRALDGDQVKAAPARVFRAYSVIQGRLEVVARIELLHGDGVSGLIGRCSVVSDDLNHSQRGLQSEINLLPVEVGLDLIGCSVWI